VSDEDHSVVWHKDHLPLTIFNTNFSHRVQKRRYLKAKDKASLGRSVAPSEASPGETKASGKGVMKSPTMMSSPLTHSAKGAEKTEILGSEKEETPKTTKGSSRRW